MSNNDAPEDTPPGQETGSDRHHLLGGVEAAAAAVSMAAAATLLASDRARQPEMSGTATALAADTGQEPPAASDGTDTNTANAVSGFRLDPSVSLSRWGGLRTAGALGVTETPHGVLSFWLRCSTSSAQADALGGTNYAETVAMIMGNDSGDPGGNSEGTAGLNIIIDNASKDGAATRGSLRLNLADAGSVAGAGKMNHSWENASYNAIADKNGTWVHYLFAWDGRGAKGYKRQALYINGVNQKIPYAGTEVGALASPFFPNINSAKGWQFNYWGDNYIAINGGYADYAQVLLDITTSIVRPPSGTFCDIDPAMVARFYNAGPVDFGTNGAGPLGFQPQFFWHGDRASFLVNRGVVGSAGNLSVIGTAPFIANAGFGPSGLLKGTAGLVWTTDSGRDPHPNVPNASTTGLPFHLGGNTLAQGDLMLFFAHGLDASGGDVDHGFGLPTDGYGSAWTLLNRYRNSAATGNQTDLAIYWKIASSADVAAAAAGTWVGHHTCTIAPTRAWNWAMLAYRGVDPNAPIAASAVSVFPKLSYAGGVNPTTPSVATTRTNTLIVHIVNSYSPYGVVTPPATVNMRFQRQPSGGVLPLLHIADEVQAVPGASIGRTWNYARKDPTQAITLALNPAPSGA